MKMEYCPTEMMIYDFYTKQFQGKLFSLFQNLISNLRKEDISNITNPEKLTKMEIKTENADRAKAVKSAQECVVENEKVGSLNTVNHDVGSGNFHNAIDMRDIILCMKPDLLSRLRLVAAGSA